MKTYKGMTRGELVKKVIDARVEQCRKQNFKKFGNNDLPRKNENPNEWYKLYKTYPMESKKYPWISLIHEYELYCVKYV